MRLRIPPVIPASPFPDDAGRGTFPFDLKAAAMSDKVPARFSASASAVLLAALGGILLLQPAPLQAGEVLGRISESDPSTLPVESVDTAPAPASPQVAVLEVQTDGVGVVAFGPGMMVELELGMAEQDELRPILENLVQSYGVALGGNDAPYYLRIGVGSSGTFNRDRNPYLSGDLAESSTSAFLFNVPVPIDYSGDVSGQPEKNNPYHLDGILADRNGTVLWQGSTRAPFAGAQRRLAMEKLAPIFVSSIGQEIREARTQVEVPTGVGVATQTPR